MFLYLALNLQITKSSSKIFYQTLTICNTFFFTFVLHNTLLYYKFFSKIVFPFCVLTISGLHWITWINSSTYYLGTRTLEYITGFQFHQQIIRNSSQHEILKLLHLFCSCNFQLLLVVMIINTFFKIWKFHRRINLVEPWYFTINFDLYFYQLENWYFYTR